jgi:hypothetical protein
MLGWVHWVCSVATEINNIVPDNALLKAQSRFRSPELRIMFAQLILSAGWTLLQLRNNDGRLCRLEYVALKRPALRVVIAWTNDVGIKRYTNLGIERVSFHECWW